MKTTDLVVCVDAKNAASLEEGKVYVKGVAQSGGLISIHYGDQFRLTKANRFEAAKYEDYLLDYGGTWRRIEEKHNGKIKITTPLSEGNVFHSAEALAKEYEFIRCADLVALKNGQVYRFYRYDGSLGNYQFNQIPLPGGTATQKLVSWREFAYVKLVDKNGLIDEIQELFIKKVGQRVIDKKLNELSIDELAVIYQNQYWINKRLEVLKGPEYIQVPQTIKAEFGKVVTPENYLEELIKSTNGKNNCIKGKQVNINKPKTIHVQFNPDDRESWVKKAFDQAGVMPEELRQMWKEHNEKIAERELFFRGCFDQLPEGDGMKIYNTSKDNVTKYTMVHDRREWFRERAQEEPITMDQLWYAANNGLLECGDILKHETKGIYAEFDGNKFDHSYSTHFQVNSKWYLIPSWEPVGDITEIIEHFEACSDSEEFENKYRVTIDDETYTVGQWIQKQRNQLNSFFSLMEQYSKALRVGKWERRK